MRELLFQFNPWWERPYRTDAVRRDRYLQRLQESLATDDVLFLVGLRRVGKTTLMHQTIEELLTTTEPQRILYASMDHPALAGTSILDLLREYRTIHGLARSDRVHLFLDEVHFVPGFERDLKAIHDHEDAKVIASGSSSLVIRQQGAHLTGRQRTIHVSPLSFQEFLAFRGLRVPESDAHLLDKHLDEYLRLGGLPEHVLRDDIEYLTSLVDSIIYKDIVGRHGVKRPEVLRKLFLLLAERAGKRLTYSKLARVLDVTTDTVKQYVDYFEETYLVHVIHRHARSLNARIYSPKKVYLADTGIRNAYTGLRDMGAVAENAVYLRLRQGGDVSYYHEGNKEVDFVQGDTAYEVKFKASPSPEDLHALVDAPFKRRVLITRRPYKDERVENETLTSFLA